MTSTLKHLSMKLLVLKMSFMVGLIQRQYITLFPSKLMIIFTQFILSLKNLIQLRYFEGEKIQIVLNEIT